LSFELIIAILSFILTGPHSPRVLIIDNNELSIQEFSATSHAAIEGLRFGFGIKAEKQPFSSNNISSTAREFEVYFYTGDISQNQIEEYIQMTNFWLDMLMIGHRIEPKYMPLSSQIDLDIKIYKLRRNTAVDGIAFTSNDPPVSSSFHAVGENWPGSQGTKNGIVVQVLPMSIGASTYVFDPRILAHEFLHNSDFVDDDLDCKSIMHGSIGSNVGWGSIYLIQKYNKIPTTDIFPQGSSVGIANIGMLNEMRHPAITNNTCTEFTDGSYLPRLTSIELSQAPINSSQLEDMIRIVNSVEKSNLPNLTMMENLDLIISTETKIKYKDNNIESMVRNAENYYRSLIEYRTLKYINQIIKKGEDISKYLDQITNSAILKALN